MRRRSMFATLSKKWSRNQRTRRRSTTNTRSSSSNNISAANNPEKIGMKLAGGESDNALPQVMKDSVSSTTMLPRDASQFSIQNNNSRFVCLIFHKTEIDIFHSLQCALQLEMSNWTKIRCTVTSFQLIWNNFVPTAYDIFLSLFHWVFWAGARVWSNVAKVFNLVWYSIPFTKTIFPD